MQIKLNNIQFTDVDYKVETFDKDITNNVETKINFKSIFDSSNERGYILEFNVELNNSNPNFKLYLKASASFTTTEVISKDLQNSKFIEINSPAIVFPYIRAFISNLTLSSGYNPIVLPTFNFVKFAETKE